MHTTHTVKVLGVTVDPRPDDIKQVAKVITKKEP